MKNHILSLSSAVALLCASVISPVVWGDDDREEHSRYSGGVSAQADPFYQQECGACHMAYPPGLLPAASWQKLLDGLHSHFGDNAELEASTKENIRQFLLTNSADRFNSKRARRFANYGGDEIIIRISELPYFKHEHDEIPSRLVKGNKAVNSFSNCNACHRRAEQASFRERDIVIPGYGRWDD